SKASEAAKTKLLSYVSRAGGAHTLLAELSKNFPKVPKALDAEVGRLNQPLPSVYQRKGWGPAECLLLAAAITAEEEYALATGDLSHLAELVQEFYENCLEHPSCETSDYTEVLLIAVCIVLLL